MIIIFLVVTLFALLTFLALGLSQLKQYKDATVTFYNFNKALLTEIAEKDANLMTELNRISDALDTFADTIEKYDPSQEIEFPNKITFPETKNTDLQDKSDAITAKITALIVNPDLKQKAHRKFKNYNWDKL